MGRDRDSLRGENPVFKTVLAGDQLRDVIPASGRAREHAQDHMRSLPSGRGKARKDVTPQGFCLLAKSPSSSPNRCFALWLGSRCLSFGPLLPESIPRTEAGFITSSSAVGPDPDSRPRRLRGCGRPTWGTGGGEGRGSLGSEP